MLLKNEQLRSTIISEGIPEHGDKIKGNFCQFLFVAQFLKIRTFTIIM